MTANDNDHLDVLVEQLSTIGNHIAGCVAAARNLENGCYDQITLILSGLSEASLAILLISQAVKDAERE